MTTDRPFNAMIVITGIILSASVYMTRLSLVTKMILGFVRRALLNRRLRFLRLIGATSDSRLLYRRTNDLCTPLPETTLPFTRLRRSATGARLLLCKGFPAAVRSGTTLSPVQDHRRLSRVREACRFTPLAPTNSTLWSRHAQIFPNLVCRSRRRRTQPAVRRGLLGFYGLRRVVVGCSPRPLLVAEGVRMDSTMVRMIL